MNDEIVFTMADGREVSETEFNTMVDRNDKALRLEQEGKEEQARILYERNIKDGFDGSGPYERLRVIYTRRKDYEQAIRICKSFLNLNQPNDKKTKSFADHLENLLVKVKKT